MSNYSPNSSFGDGSNTAYVVRWRGLQYGPFTGTAIEEKLATNQLSLLHEISYNGRWITIRDFIAEREAVKRAERLAQENQERRAREEAERQARDEEWQIREESRRQALQRQDQQHAETMAVERRRNELLEARPDHYHQDRLMQRRPMNLKPHRGGLILSLGIGGLFCLGFLSIPAWIMGTTDLGEMDSGLMDDSGRGRTRTGQILGIIGCLCLAFWGFIFLITQQ